MMKQQVVVIHGGHTFRSYDAYLERLKSEEIDFERMTDHSKRGWKANLAEALGDAFEVAAPRMPNGQNAQYAEWAIWFQKLFPHLRDGVILVGHSLGGIFLAKYLSENSFPKAIRATMLVAAPYDADGDPDLAAFVPGSVDRFAKQGGSIFLYYSEDDAVVPFAELEQYAKRIPDATVRTFADRGHFHAEEFPELEEDIRSLA